MSFVPASSLSHPELAELFTRGYEGYFVPIHLDEASLRYIVDAWDIDLDRSLVAPGEGIVNLGVRGDRGWIGGLGVVPGARRKGIGRALMEAVLEHAPPTVTLEVIDVNEPAVRLYESLGFERTRVLEVWSVEAAEVAARRVEPAPLGQEGLPWQREDASLPAEYERFEVDGGAMLLRNGSVLQLEARDAEAAKALLSRGTKVQYVNVPEDDPASVALAELGGERSLRQFEMRYAH